MTDQLDPGQRSRVTTLCEAAFGESWRTAWDEVGPGLHVLLEESGHLVSHALIVDRQLYAGTEPEVVLDVGYVEWVATSPDRQGQGLGRSVMTEVGRIIRDEFALGALTTGSMSFYEKSGWERWAGPTFVRMSDGDRVRSPAADGHVLVLRTPRTPAMLDLAGPIACDWRRGDPW
jgi:aminoglycoside 2'-N-acetyltransferase I